MPDTPTPSPTIDGATLVDQLFRLLRLKTTPVGIQMFERVEDMEAVSKIRRPGGAIFTTDQIIGQAARLGFTVGITAADLVGPQCAAVIGLAPQNEEWQAGKPFAGVWFATEADAAAHQRAMHCVPYGRYQAMAVSPLASGRLNPDICLVYANPAQMILLINGLQWSGYRKLQGRRGRIGLRRLVGPRAGHRRAQPVAAVFPRAALRRRARRRTADGAEAPGPGQGAARAGRAGAQRPALSHPPLRSAVRRACRHVGQLRQEVMP